MAVPPSWDRRCLRYRRRELWPLLFPLVQIPAVVPGAGDRFDPTCRKQVEKRASRRPRYSCGSRAETVNLILPTGRSCRLVLGKRLQRILFQGEDVLGDNPIGPLTGGRLAV